MLGEEVRGDLSDDLGVIVVPRIEAAEELAQVGGSSLQVQVLFVALDESASEFRTGLGSDEALTLRNGQVHGLDFRKLGHVRFATFECMGLSDLFEWLVSSVDFEVTHSAFHGSAFVVTHKWTEDVLLRGGLAVLVGRNHFEILLVPRLVVLVLSEVLVASNIIQSSFITFERLAPLSTFINGTPTSLLLELRALRRAHLRAITCCLVQSLDMRGLRHEILNEAVDCQLGFRLFLFSEFLVLGRFRRDNLSWTAVFAHVGLSDPLGSGVVCI